MNWLDIAFLAIFALLGYLGLKNGLLGAAFSALAFYIGSVLAGQFSGDLAMAITDDPDLLSYASFGAYAIIIAAVSGVGVYAWKFVRPLLTAATLGMSSMVDKVGGLALGLLVGVAISAGLIVVLARLSYSFEELPAEGIAGQVVSRVPNVEATREGLESALSGSAIAKIVVNIMDKVPANAFGVVPDQYADGIDTLKDAMDELDLA